MDLVDRMKIAVPSMFGHWVRRENAIYDDLTSDMSQSGRFVSGESEVDFYGWEVEFRVTQSTIEALVFAYSGYWEAEEVFQVDWKERFEILFEDIANFVNKHS